MTKSRIILIGCFFMTHAIFASPLNTRERWTINQDQREAWEAIINKAGLTHAYVQETLAKHQLVTLEFGPVSHPTPIATYPIKEPIPETLIWDDGQTSVYYASNPRVRNHLWVVLNRPVNRFSEVTVEEAVALRATVNKIIYFLRETYKIPSSIIAQWNVPQFGNFPNRFTIEVIPPIPETKDVHNVWDKTESNNHVLFRGRFPSTIAGPTKEEIHSDVEYWKKALEDSPVYKQEAEDFKPWTQVQVYKKKAAECLLDWFYQSLVEGGIQIERAPLHFEAQKDEPIITNMGRCSFCLEKVIESQKIFETDHALLIYNYKPSTMGKHFLIIPKRHVGSSDKLTKEEIEDIHRLSVKAVRALEELVDPAELKMYIQDGPSVGQVVNHVNMHILITPNPIKYMLFGINYESERTYSREEMLPFLSSLIERLNQ